MSFSSQSKNELCKNPISFTCCILSELYAFSLLSSKFSPELICIKTENIMILKRISILCEKAFNFEPQSLKTKRRFIMSITSPVYLKKIFESFGYDYKKCVSYRLNRNIIEENCCKISFLRGVFLSCGIIIDPEKEYHLEMIMSHKNLCHEIVSLMLDMNLNPKTVERKGNSIIYFKDSIQIEDFLTLIGASNCSMAIMQAKAEKDLRNNINRKVNCETANLSKTIDASLKQCNMIQKIIASYGTEVFPEHLRDTVILRINNPTMSLSELADLSRPTCSKSGMNHRIRKITGICRKLGEM